MGLKCIMRRAEIIYINYRKLIRIEISHIKLFDFT